MTSNAESNRTEPWGHWNVANFYPPYPSNGAPMKTLEYRGYSIVEVNYNPTIGDTFNPDRVYTVKDEFDDPLPILQQTHWTPFDAMAAVDIVLNVPTNKHKWPSTVVYEYNQSLRYRRHWGLTYAALLDVEAICVSALDFDDNPTQEVLDRIRTLKATVMSL